MNRPTKTAKQLLELKQQSGAITVSPDNTVLYALKVLAEHDIGAVLVLEGDRLVGILSERDCVRKVELQGRTATSTHVGEIMTSRVISVRPDQTTQECRKVMGEARIRHLAVVNAGRIVGVLSSKDILDEIIAEDQEIIQQLETTRLRRGVWGLPIRS